MLLQLSQFNKIKSPTQKRETKHLFGHDDVTKNRKIRVVIGVKFVDKEFNM